MNFLLFFLLLTLTYQNQVNADANSDQLLLVQAMNGFGINLYKELAKSKENLICSGYSVDTVLNMILVGSRTTTESELRKALGYQAAGLSNSQVLNSNHQLLTQQRSNKNDYDLDVANSMWIQQGFPVLPNYTKTIRDNFYAEVEEHISTEDINNWVKNETKGKIPKLFDSPLDDSTRLVLVNAMYFKGSWVTKFKKNLTKDEPFTGTNGNSKNTPMMNVVSNFPYTLSTGLNAQVLELPYNGKDVSMYIFLPSKVNNLESLQQKLSPKAVQNAMSQVATKNVHVKMPKFNISSTFILNKPLQDLGIESMFKRADLSGIDGKQDLVVSFVLQKAIIEVSEEGTIAAAATAAVVSTTSLNNPPTKDIYFTADHPFLYFIVHKPTGLHLFTGSFVKP